MDNLHVVKDVLLPNDALLVLQHRSALGRDVKVHICGRVCCLSEIIKVKDTRLFMVQLEHGLNIIVKKESKLTWHDQLDIGGTYVFTHMVPTSLQQGGEKQHAVYAVKDKSYLYNENNVRTNTISTAEWMSKHAPTSKLDGAAQFALNGANRCRHSDMNNLVSYEGQVSAVLDKGMGIYELDGEVRLYVGSVPAVHKFAMIGEGSRLSIHNAHTSQHSQAGKKSLYCCMLTSIIVMAHPQCQAQSSASLGKHLQRLVYLSSLSQAQLDYVYTLRVHLKQAVHHLYGNRFPIATTGCYRTRERMLSILLQDPTFTAVFSSCPARNLPDEFLASPHSCGFSRSSQTVPLPLVSVKDILRQHVPAPCGVNGEQGGWSYTTCLNTQEMLVGGLNCCSDSGRPYIEDSTGRLDIVCCKRDNIGPPHQQHNDSTTLSVDGNDTNNGTSKHDKCSEQCHCTVLKPGAAFPCNFIHSCCLGNIVLVKKYEIVTEFCPQDVHMRRQTTGRVSGASFNSRSVQGRCRYLIVDMEHVNCIICDTLGSNTQGRSKETMNTFNVWPKQCEKRKLNDNGSDIEPMEHSDLIAGVLKPKRDTVMENICTGLASISSKKGEALDGKLSSKTKIKDIRQVCLLAEVTVCVETIGSVVSGGKKEEGRIDSQFFVEADIVAGDRIFKVCLAFCGDLVRYYPILCPGYSYTLSLVSELSPLLCMNVANTQIQRAAIKSKSRVLLLVHEKTVVREHWTAQTAGRQRLTELTNVLDNSYVGTFVSFKGKITQRMYCHKEGETSAAKGGPFTKVEVQDLENEDLKIWVYIDERDITCHQGLIPRAHVLWITLERKLAHHTPGGAAVYCRLIPCSSVRLIGHENIRCMKDYGVEEDDFDDIVREMQQQQRQQQNNITTTNVPHLLLDELYRRSPDLNLFTCVCDVLSISNLTLQVKCNLCSSLMAQGHCDNVVCDNTENYRFFPRASLLVDDGTAIALVKVKGPCVRTVLNMTPDQWTALETEVWRCREVFFQKLNSFITHKAKLSQSSWLERFICHVCESQSVHQSLMLTCRVSKLPDIHQMPKSEFFLKDMDVDSNRMKTRYTPIPHLDCVGLDKYDAARFMLQNISK